VDVSVSAFPAARRNKKNQEDSGAAMPRAAVM
jgi:hypothetical protein